MKTELNTSLMSHSLIVLFPFRPRVAIAPRHITAVRVHEGSRTSRNVARCSMRRLARRRTLIRWEGVNAYRARKDWCHVRRECAPQLPAAALAMRDTPTGGVSLAWNACLAPRTVDGVDVASLVHRRLASAYSYAGTQRHHAVTEHSIDGA